MKFYENPGVLKAFFSVIFWRKNYVRNWGERGLGTIGVYKGWGCILVAKFGSSYFSEREASDVVRMESLS